MSQPDFKGMMRILAAAEDIAATLPDADVVWERALARAEWRQRELATRAIRLAERLALIACAAAGIAGLVVVRSSIDTVVRAMNEMLVGLGVLTVTVTLGAASVFLKMLLDEE
jgi:hypothetical protein